MAPQKKITIAEANAITNERAPLLPKDATSNAKATRFSKGEPFMPHLTYTDRAVMDELFPPIAAAAALADNDGDGDSKDEVFQTGLAIVQGIREKLICDGRRRRVGP